MEGLICFFTGVPTTREQARERYDRDTLALKESFAKLLLLLDSLEKDYCYCYSNDKRREVRIDIVSDIKYREYLSYSELIEFSEIELKKQINDFFKIKEDRIWSG